MGDLSGEDLALLERARQAARNAYAPYSNFHVGAAVVAADGRVFTAANVENASYGLSLCAEANAISAAVGTGVRELTRVAVVGYPSGTDTGAALATPCGRCRQIIAEFARPELVVIVADKSGARTLTIPLAELLPHPFQLL